MKHISLNDTPIYLDDANVIDIHVDVGNVFDFITDKMR